MINQQELDSKEELYFIWYLEELLKHGFIFSYKKITEPYILTHGLHKEYVVPMKRVDDKIKVQTLLSPSEYTPDFSVLWTEKAKGVFIHDLSDESSHKVVEPFISQNYVSIIETKGNFDSNNMTRLAVNNIKFVYSLYNEYVNLIKIPTIFNKTFTPKRYLKTDKSGKPRKIKYKNILTIEEFIEKATK